MVDSPHDYYYGSGSAASNFAKSEGLTSPAPVNTGVPGYSGPDPNGVYIIEESGRGRWITPNDLNAANDPKLWMDSKKSLYNELYPSERQDQLDNYERYVAGTGNSTEARYLWDEDGENGYSTSYNSGVYIDNDANNVLSRAYEWNEKMANSYFARYPEKLGTMSIIQAAKAFLDENKIMVNKKDLNAARKAWNSGGGGGRVTTVRSTEELTGQQLRGQGNPTAVETMGRTLGVGEADEVVEQLNKESRKNPKVTTGIGTGTQKTMGGYDFRQGLEDALAGTFDGEASQKVTRGIGLLERALGDVRGVR